VITPRRAVSLPRALSKLGLCSRKQAFDYVGAGRVEVNGRVSRDASLRVSLEADRVSVDGRAAGEFREAIVVALHKPAGYLTTRSDPQGRPTVYDLLPSFGRFVFPVGRLDKETTGLLILTDDHQLGEALTNPEKHVPKSYEVLVDRRPDATQVNALRTGINLGKGDVTRPATVDVGASPAGVVVRIVLSEGKNRQVRRMFAAVSVRVLNLRRVAIGRFRLGSLPEGRFRLLSNCERERLVGTNGASRPPGRI
jgi:23S rRNA pseudouridine2605 synthase